MVSNAVYEILLHSNRTVETTTKGHIMCPTSPALQSVSSVYSVPFGETACEFRSGVCSEKIKVTWRCERFDDKFSCLKACPHWQQFFTGDRRNIVAVSCRRQFVVRRHFVASVDAT